MYWDVLVHPRNSCPTTSEHNQVLSKDGVGKDWLQSLTDTLFIAAEKYERQKLTTTAFEVREHKPRIHVSQAILHDALTTLPTRSLFAYMYTHIHRHVNILLVI